MSAHVYQLRFVQSATPEVHWTGIKYSRFIFIPLPLKHKTKQHTTPSKLWLELGGLPTTSVSNEIHFQFVFVQNGTQTRHVIIDCSCVPFVDYTGASLLHEVLKQSWNMKNVFYKANWIVNIISAALGTLGISHRANFVLRWRLAESKMR